MFSFINLNTHNNIDDIEIISEKFCDDNLDASTDTSGTANAADIIDNCKCIDNVNFKLNNNLIDQHSNKSTEHIDIIDNLSGNMSSTTDLIDGERTDSTADFIDNDIDNNSEVGWSAEAESPRRSSLSGSSLSGSSLSGSSLSESIDNYIINNNFPKIITEISPLLFGFYCCVFNKSTITPCVILCNNLSYYHTFCKYDAFFMYMSYVFVYKNFIFNLTESNKKKGAKENSKSLAPAVRDAISETKTPHKNNSIINKLFKNISAWDIVHIKLNIIFGVLYPSDIMTFLLLNTSFQLFSKLNNIYDIRIFNFKLNSSNTKNIWKFNYKDIVHSLFGFSIGHYLHSLQLFTYFYSLIY